MYPAIKTYINGLNSEFDLIPEERKRILETIASYISKKIATGSPVNLVYICTHNSRRSHFGQIWAHVAANYYGIKNVSTFSGGTEATAFNVNAINALKRVGFTIVATTNTFNSTYQVFHADNEMPSICFSKTYDHPANPQKDFAAIMTCGEAEENCPFIPGVDLRIATTYDDPKHFEGTPLQDEKYDERCRQIARETFYAFSKV